MPDGGRQVRRQPVSIRHQHGPGEVRDGPLFSGVLSEEVIRYSDFDTEIDVPVAGGQAIRQQVHCPYCKHNINVLAHSDPSHRVRVGIAYGVVFGLPGALVVAGLFERGLLVPALFVGVFNFFVSAPNLFAWCQQFNVVGSQAIAGRHQFARID